MYFTLKKRYETVIKDSENKKILNYPVYRVRKKIDKI